MACYRSTPCRLRPSPWRRRRVCGRPPRRRSCVHAVEQVDQHGSSREEVEPDVGWPVQRAEQEDVEEDGGSEHLGHGGHALELGRVLAPSCRCGASFHTSVKASASREKAAKNQRNHRIEIRHMAEIKIGFTLEKPVSFLTAHIQKLGSDIFEEIGVPNGKVSIVSMHPLPSKYSTQVVFGVLPYPKNASISLPALSVLRSSLIEMMLQQLNLSLTPSVFGHPSSVELLRFPGGITVIPAQSGFMWVNSDPLFNFVLNNSIYQILGNLTELKDQLKLGLNLRSYEKIYFRFRNEIGSSVEAPVSVGASVLDGSNNLLPDRLKQLALLITEPDEKNLGLNHSVFGKVKRVQLSSYLQHSISDMSPGPSPSPSPSPSLAPSQSPSPSLPPSLSPSGSIPYPPPPIYTKPSLPPQASPPLWSRHPCLPCLSCSRFPPIGGPTVTPPCVPKLPPFLHSPEPSIVPSPPTHLSPSFPPVPRHKNAPRHLPKTVPGPISHMMPIPSPSVHVFHPMPPRKKRNSRKSKLPTIAPSPYSLLHT